MLLKLATDQTYYVRARTRLEGYNLRQRKTGTAKCDESRTGGHRHYEASLTHEQGSRTSHARVVKNLGVSVLLKTSFIASVVKRIYPAERKLAPYNLQLVPVLMIHEASVDNRTITRNRNEIGGAVVAMKTGNRNVSCACRESQYYSRCPEHPS